MLDKYAELKAQKAVIESQLAEIEAQLAEHVQAHGEAAGYGYRAYIKPGRKSTDHEAAYKAGMAEIDEHEMHSTALKYREAVEKHSTTKVTVAWAKVTAALKIDTAPFTVEGQPQFVIEEVKQ
jgi:hypothetical protein